MAFHWTLFSI